jgi:hypothetical protein
VGVGASFICKNIFHPPFFIFTCHPIKYNFKFQMKKKKKNGATKIKIEDIIVHVKVF